VSSGVAFTDIDTDDNRIVKALEGIPDEISIDYRRRAQNYPLNACFQQVFDSGQVADTAAELGGDEHSTDNFLDDVKIDYLTGSGTVKIDDVKSRGPHGLPFQGYIEGVVGIYRFFIIVALVKPYALPVFQVYGWYNFYYFASRKMILLGNYSIVSRCETMCIGDIDKTAILG